MKSIIKKAIAIKLAKFIASNCELIDQFKNRSKETYLRSKYNIAHTFRFGDIDNIHFLGENIQIGANSYFNSGRINAGKTAKVVIGEWCAIGYNVNIIAKTHNIKHPTGIDADDNAPEKDILIGNNVWIGTNVFIKEGVNIGNNVVVGANSVVTKDIPQNAVVGGVPAKVLYIKK